MASGSMSQEDTLPQVTSDNESDDSNMDPNYEETSGETESDTSSEEQRGRSRKRKRNKREREINKERKDQGKSYKHSKRKERVYPAKSVGPNCDCPKKCFEEIGQNVIGEIFTGFWGLANRDKQNSYLFGCIETVPVSRRYGDREKSKRKCSVVYSVQGAEGRSIVCKKAFLSVHGLQQNRGRVDNVVKTIRDGNRSPVLDRRGKHENRANAYSEEHIEQVKEHIRSIPKYSSHYSRRDNPNKTYLSMDYTILSCYQNYAEDYCVRNGFQPVSKDKYRRIFTEDFNIGIHKPKTDTCKTCDEFIIKLKEASDKKDDVAAFQLKKEQELHHRKAQAGQDDIKQQKAKALSEDGYHVITFDLQQALPTPKLSTGPAFYKRKVWTYNLNVHDCKSETGYCYVWDESIAGRGSEEIGSCVRKHIETNNIHGGTLIAISDNCGGQNKNWTIQFMWLYYIATGRFETVEHHFPLSGHSMLPSDRDFGLVENYVRKHVQQVYTPSQWREVIAKSARSLKVVEMKSKDFAKLTDLKGYFTIKQKTTDGDPVNFKSVVRFRMTVGKFGSIQTSPNFNSDVWNTVSVGRRGKTRHDVAAVKFPQKYEGPRLLDQQKVADVVSLLPYIPPVYSGYFTSLKSVRKNDRRDDDEDDDIFCFE